MEKAAKPARQRRVNFMVDSDIIERWEAAARATGINNLSAWMRAALIREATAVLGDKETTKAR